MDHDVGAAAKLQKMVDGSERAGVDALGWPPLAQLRTTLHGLSFLSATAATALVVSPVARLRVESRNPRNAGRSWSKSLISTPWHMSGVLFRRTEPVGLNGSGTKAARYMRHDRPLNYQPSRAACRAASTRIAQRCRGAVSSAWPGQAPSAHARLQKAALFHPLGTARRRQDDDCAACREGVRL